MKSTLILFHCESNTVMLKNLISLGGQLTR